MNIYISEKSYTFENDYFNASYGIVPKCVSDYQRNMLFECESNPYKWFTQTYKDKVIQTKKRLSSYLNASVSDFVIVDNSSSAANSIFDSLQLSNTSVIILLETAYGLIENLTKKMAMLYGCKIVTIPVDVDHINNIKVDIVNKIDYLRECGFYVKLVCIDHISSCPAILIPVSDIALQCKKYQIPVLVDGAHALGQARIDLKAFEDAGVTYWFTDTHKWFFSPKGSAILWVSKNKQSNVYPTIDCAAICSKGCTIVNRCVSPDLRTMGGRTTIQPKLSDFEKRFLYLGTKDYTPWISINAAIDFVEFIGGYDFLINRNRDLALWTQNYLSEKLETKTIHDELTVSMCNIYIPFVKSKYDSENLIQFLMNKNVFGVVCEYPTKQYWLRLCIQVFIDKCNIERLLSVLQEYKLQIGQE